MKRNSKYLLVLSMLICTIGLFMVGCDDTTVNPPPVEIDRVVGSIEGVVLDANTHEPIGDLYVIYWDSTDVRDTVMAEDDGSFLIPGPLPSGHYTIHIVDPEDGYTYGLTVAYIPTVEELKGDIDVNPSGPIYYRASFFDDCEDDNCLGAILLFNKCASVRGQLWSAIQDAEDYGPGAPKTEEGGFALQPPISAIGNVTVVLNYPEDCGVVPLKWETITDPDGFYTFTGLPEYDGAIDLTIPPFPYGDSSYQQFDTTIYLVSCEPITVPDIYGIVDCRSIPVILSYNFPNELPFDYYGNLVLEFSEPMNTNSFSFALRDVSASETVAGTFTWNNASEGGFSADSILTFDPHMTLLTGHMYRFEIYNAESKSGCMLASQFANLSFYTASGIALFARNYENATGHFTDFQIEDDIALTFTMIPVIDPIYGTLSLTDITTGIGYLIAIDSSVSGNILTIDPRDNLEMSHKYEVCYKMFSSIPGDFVEDCDTFWTEIDTTKVQRVTGWAINADIDCSDNSCWRADWNTTTIPFRWNKVDNAQYYSIYAYDNSPEIPNTDFIKIATVASQDHLQFQVADVVLPAQFDRYKNDGLQTPFTDNTTIYFMVRAGNAAGLGPHSDTIDIKDTTPPGGGDATNDNLVVAATWGSADNTVSSFEDTVWISLTEEGEYFQREDNPEWDFVEAGGDEAYELPDDVGLWNWRNDSRFNDATGSATGTGALFTVPGNSCGAGDTLYMKFWDNSGNDTTIQFRVRPYIEYDAPVAGDAIEAPGHNVTWSVYTPPGFTFGSLDYFLTLDGSFDFIDTNLNFHSNSGTNIYASLENYWMSDNLARVALQDADGGCFWLSDYITVNGFEFTNLDDIHAFDAMPFVYDQMGTDSTVIPITWSSVGIDSFDVYYTISDSIYNFADFQADGVYDTTIENTGSFDWYPPDVIGTNNYRTWIVFADADVELNPNTGNDYPWDHTETGIDITHDSIDVTAPADGNVLAGGEPFTVEWDVIAGSADAVLTFDYFYERTWITNPGYWDTTWYSVTMASYLNDEDEVWADVPDTTPLAETRLRVTNANGEVLWVNQGTFAITGITIDPPVDPWLIGSSQTITWTCGTPALVGDVELWYSTDGWTGPDSLLLSGGPTTNDGSYTWNVSSPPSHTTQIRVKGVTQPVYATTEDFTVSGVTVTNPDGGEIWSVGAAATIEWDTTTTDGVITLVDIEYTANGINWNSIATAQPNTGLFTWDPVANLTSDGLARVRISENITALGADISDNPFDIAGIIVSAPTGGDDWANGTTQRIEWSEISTIGSTLRIEYRLTAAGNWYEITTGVPVGQGYYDWYQIQNHDTSTNEDIIGFIEWLDSADPTEFREGVGNRCDVDGYIDYIVGLIANSDDDFGYNNYFLYNNPFEEVIIHLLHIQINTSKFPINFKIDMLCHGVRETENIECRVTQLIDQHAFIDILTAAVEIISSIMCCIRWKA